MESEAASATRRAVELLDPAEVLLKTVDSTLRGHVRAEIAAAENRDAPPAICLAPAFPGAGRTTREGIQEVHGRPLLETSYAADAEHPARSERLAELVEGLGRARLVHARDGWPELGGERVLLVDVEQQEELDAFVAEARDADDWLWVGSPGLALAWGRRLAQVSPRAPSPGARPARRVLTAVGSLNRVSRRQLAVVASASEGREDLTVLATPDEVQGDPAQAIEALARDVAALADPPAFDGLVATGGATMEALLEALGVDAFDPAGELTSRASRTGSRPRACAPRPQGRRFRGRGRPPPGCSYAAGRLGHEPPAPRSDHGDPSGIGPEVLVRAVGGAPARCVALGDPADPGRGRGALRTGAAGRAPRAPEDVSGEEGLLEVLATGLLDEELVAGEVRPASGEAACGAVVAGIDLALAGRVQGTRDGAPQQGGPGGRGPRLARAHGTARRARGRRARGDDDGWRPPPRRARDHPLRPRRGAGAPLDRGVCSRPSASRALARPRAGWSGLGSPSPGSTLTPGRAVASDERSWRYWRLPCSRRAPRAST